MEELIKRLPEINAGYDKASVSIEWFDGALDDLPPHYRVTLVVDGLGFDGTAEDLNEAARLALGNWDGHD